MFSKNQIIVYIILITGWLGYVWFSEVSNQNLKVYTFDVGQGDSILIRTPHGKNVLIDGGKGDYLLAGLAMALPPWIRQIDVMILTHPHADHFSGLLDVIERYEIKEIWWDPICYGAPEYGAFVEMVVDLRTRGCSVLAVSESKVMIEQGVELHVLFPQKWDTKRWTRALDEKEVEWCENFGIVCNAKYDGNVNNDSVIVLLKYGDFEVLLTGDAEVEVEEDLVSHALRVGLVDVDVLKAGHHCSKTASSREFLHKTKPELAICSCGKGNKFGHPHEETLENFDDLGIEYLRTDQVGTILIESDGINWWVE